MNYDILHLIAFDYREGCVFGRVDLFVFKDFIIRATFRK